MADAIALMEQAFRLHAAGKLIAPPRLQSEVKTGTLMFTCGAIDDPTGNIGFRVYDWKQLSSPDRSEMTPLFSSRDGRVEGLCVGPLLGAWRTGAIGGAILKHVTSIESGKLALVGTGYQARTQLLAAVTALPFEEVEIYGRTIAKASVFVNEMKTQLADAGHPDVRINLANSIEQAVRDADAVISATTSRQPLYREEWLSENVHLHNVGPKFRKAHEIPVEVIDTCDTITTDALAQALSYDNFLLNGTAAGERLREFSELMQSVQESDKPKRRWNAIRTERSYCCSIGLAGTELLIARAAIQARIASESNSLG